MAPRGRLRVHYPSRPSLEQTLASGASLSGTRRFLAGEGLCVFADAKVGISRAAGDVWLRPSAYRKMSNFLDLKRYSSVAGLRLIWNETAHRSLLGDDLFDDLRGVLRDGRGRKVGDRNIEVQSIEQHAGSWSQKAVLVYDHFTTLAGGDRLLDEGRVVVYARKRDDGTVDLAFVMNRQDDFEVVRQWLRASDTDNRWLWTAEHLPRENPTRQKELEQVLGAIRGRSLLAVSHPDIYRGRGKPNHDSRFVSVYKRASYETEMTDVEVIVERMEADGGIIGALTVYTRRPSEQEVVSLRLQQRPKDDHLRLIWRPSKIVGPDDLRTLTQSGWTDLRPVEWGEEQKHACLLAAWAEIIDARIPPTGIQLAAGA